MRGRAPSLAARAPARVLASVLLLSGTAVGGLGAQAEGVERAGDVLMYSLPVGTLGSTLILEDYVGSRDFLYGFALNAAVTGGLKLLVHKERPDGSDGKSFPSGHTSISFQSASFIHERYGLEYGAPAYAVAAFVGYSRVAARAHFPADVAAGLVLGIVSSRIFAERRREDGTPANEGLGAGFSLRFGGGLAPSLSFQLLQMAR